MSNFEQVYKKALKTVTDQKFADDWDLFLRTDVKVQSLLGATGFSSNEASGLDKLRKKIQDSTKHGAVAAFFVGGGVADTILTAARNAKSAGSTADRAATLKFLKHVYLTRVRGGQEVWCYAGPKAYSKFVFDEITGEENSFKSKLKSESEVYDAKTRTAMCDALQLALTWTQKAAASLGNAKARSTVKAWFADQNTTDKQIDTAVTTLRDGLLKVAGVCNSSRLVFSDHPPDRSKGGWKDWAFVYKGESMDVVYMQGAATKAARSASQQWKCALTIIHELTHRELKTDDIRYDFDGLKPDATDFPFNKAIINADSWAYFTLDLVGVLPPGDRSSVLS
ncbi:MAG: M35 family metallo-endopeptidase [Hydrogenophilaceae bacterium]